MRLFLIAALPLALFIYGHGLQAPYYLDDRAVLEGAANYSPDLGDRTVAYASFYLNTLAIDAVGPLFHWKPSFYYRLVNLLIHVLASAVLLGLVRELTGCVSTAYAVGFLFLVHPLTSEPVMYVSQRFQSLATLWIFVAGWSYARFRKSGDWISGDRRWLLVTLVASAAALFTKPFAYVLPLWILVLEFTYFSKLEVELALFVFYTCRRDSPLAAFVVLEPAQCKCFRCSPLGSVFANSRTGSAQVPPTFRIPRRTISFYDFPLATSISWSVILQWAVVLAVLATGFLVLRRYPGIGFGILTFFVLLLPLILIRGRIWYLSTAPMARSRELPSRRERF